MDTLPARVTGWKAEEVARAFCIDNFSTTKTLPWIDTLALALSYTTNPTNVTVATAQTRIWATGLVTRETMVSIGQESRETHSCLSERSLDAIM